jgi:KDO2-lipid IV(A) lauroyltransferase
MLFFRFLSILPFPILYGFSTLLYFIFYKCFGYRKKVVFQNLQNSFPTYTQKELDKIAQGFYRQLCDLIVESIKLLSIKEDVLRKRLTIKNIDLPIQYLNNNKPIIVLTGHTGNWEWLLQACQLYSPIPVAAVYKPLSNTFFDKLMLKIRTRFGANLVPMKDVPRFAVKNKNKIWALAMVADQTPLKSEIQFINTFLNQRTPWFVGAEKIADMTSAQTLYVGMNKIKRGHYEVYFEVIDNPDNKDKNSGYFPVIDAFSKQLENNISQNPSSWLWSHRRWKHQV